MNALDIPYEVRVRDDIDESYPPTLPTMAVAEYISEKKSMAYDIGEDELLLTADTVVVLGSEIIGKPKDLEDAKEILRKLSGETHKVVTGCCLRTRTKKRHFSVISEVTFAPLTKEDIDYYVDNYHPLDKAGAYGVQEWIGCVGVKSIQGSYFNVMGLPVQRVWEVLKNF